MRDPRKPDTQADQYIADLASAHRQRTDAGDRAGVNPRQPDSMPRSEDDRETRADSPEFHDRTDVPQGGTSGPPRGRR